MRLILRVERRRFEELAADFLTDSRIIQEQRSVEKAER